MLGGNTLALDGVADTTFGGGIGGTGGLVKIGAGMQTLGSANSFSGGVTLNAGGLVVGNDAALGTGDLTVAAAATLDSSAAVALANHVVLNAALTLPGSKDLAFDGVISGVGGLAKAGNATLTLNGANTFSGGSTINGGTLVLGNNAALGTGDLSIDGAKLEAGTAVTIGNHVNVGNNGLTVQGAQALNLSGSFSGDGLLDKEGSGALTLGGSLAGFTGGLNVEGGTLNASNTYTGGLSMGAGATANLNGSGNAVTVSGPIAGTLNLGGGSNIDVSYANLPSVTGTVNGTGPDTTLNITGSGEASLPGAFNDIANLRVDAGTLSVDSGMSVTFAGGSTIGGNLVVNGNLGGPVTVNAGGGLVGGGSIGGPVTMNGTLAPGGIAGATGAAGGTGAPGSVLSVGGLALGADSSTLIRANVAGASDRLQVNGVASLAGQLVALPSAGTYATTTNYTIVNASGGITGAYATITQSTLPFLDASVKQQGNQLILTLTQAGSGQGTGGTPFNQFAGLDGNQRRMATVLQAIATSGGNPLPTLLGNARGLTAGQVSRSFDSLTGETYASAANAELNGQSQYQNTVFDRLGLARDTGEQGMAAWAQPYTSSSNFDGSTDIAHAHYRINGLIVGADASLTPDLRVGVHANLANSRTDVDQRSDHADVDQAAIGVHALYFNQQQWWVEGLASYGWQHADSARRIEVGQFDPQATGRYDGKATNAALEGGYRFQLGQGLHLEPFVGAYYTKVKYDAFTERNADDADLRVGNNSASSMQYGAGVRLIGDAGMGANGTPWFHPVVMLRYLHNTRDDATTVNNAFAGVPADTFTVQGSQPVGNHWQAGVGMSFDITPKASTFVYYNADIAQHMTDNSVNLGLRWGF